MSIALTTFGTKWTRLSFNMKFMRERWICYYLVINLNRTFLRPLWSKLLEFSVIFGWGFVSLTIFVMKLQIILCEIEDGMLCGACDIHYYYTLLTEKHLTSIFYFPSIYCGRLVQYTIIGGLCYQVKRSLLSSSPVYVLWFQFKSLMRLLHCSSHVCAGTNALLIFWRWIYSFSDEPWWWGVSVSELLPS